VTRIALGRVRGAVTDVEARVVRDRHRFDERLTAQERHADAQGDETTVHHAHLAGRS
jgi:hypothetical protein